jgi:hypothetical protein
MYVVFALVVLSVLLYSIFWSDSRRIRCRAPAGHRGLLLSRLNEGWQRPLR